MKAVRQGEMPWASFAASITDMARRLPDDAAFPLYRDEGEVDGLGSSWPRYVQVCRYGGTMLRCEVVSNTYLPAEYRWTPQQEERLAAMGWNRPDLEESAASPNWYLDVSLAWAETGIERIVRVLRDLWGARLLHDVVLDQSDMRGFLWIDTPEDLTDDPGR